MPSLGRMAVWILTAGVCFGAFAGAEESVSLRTVSSRPDIVSGSSVLIEAVVPRSLRDGTDVLLNGQATSSTFERDREGRHLALLNNLHPGRNLVEIKRSGILLGSISFNDFPLSGPIFSGPQQKPWLCETQNFKLPDKTTLPASTGPDCSIPKPVVQYLYRKTENTRQGAQENVSGAAGSIGIQDVEAELTKFVVLNDPTRIPANVAITKTRDGREVRFIIRVETGTANRGIYQIATLFDPATDTVPDPWRGPASWNGELIYTFGGGCGPGYHQGLYTGGVLTKLYELSKGYAVASSTLNVWQNTCNTAVSAETMAMVKARFVEEFGIPKDTIGEGESGGAKSQLMIAQNYPGLLDGILPGIQTGPDGVTTNPTVLDCALLIRYFNNKTKLPWTYEQKTAVAGWADWNNCERQPNQTKRSASWGGLFSPNYAVPTAHMPFQGIGCAAEIPSDWIYEPKSNPSGARCDMYSNQISIFGEISGSGGKPRRPFDSVGIQYGLATFNAGKISADQFVELNEEIGGYDEDGNYVDQRTEGDPAAIRIAYETGQVLSGGGRLNETPIIDLRRYTELTPDIHDRVASFNTRERLIQANGNADNYVMYTFPKGLVGPLASESVWDVALEQMSTWLNRIRTDHSALPLAIKVRRNKPDDLHDACWDQSMQRIQEPASYSEKTKCNALFPAHSNPRLVAGMSLAHDVLKCVLKPINPAEYHQRLDQSHFTKLRAVFPGGVCDYSKPGVEQLPLAGTWFAYLKPGKPSILGLNEH